MTKISIYSYSKYLIYVLATCFLIPSLSTAETLSVWPKSIELTSTKRTAPIKVVNSSNFPITVQVKLNAWVQDQSREIYTPTKELLTSNAVINVAANSAKIIHLSLLRAADPQKELAYSVHFEEVATHKVIALTGVSKDLAPVSVPTAVPVLLPVFVVPDVGKRVSKLLWSVSIESNTLIKLQLQNEGSSHIKITNLLLSSIAEEHPLASLYGSSYILASQAHTWLLTPTSEEDKVVGHVHLKAYSDAFNVDTVLAVEKP